jgi:hypothetical protein
MADTSGKQDGSGTSSGQASGGRDSGQSDAVVGEATYGVVVGPSGQTGPMNQVISSGEQARRRNNPVCKIDSPPLQGSESFQPTLCQR